MRFVVVSFLFVCFVLISAAIGLADGPDEPIIAPPHGIYVGGSASASAQSGNVRPLAADGGE
jgi:hypothetical protein